MMAWQQTAGSAAGPIGKLFRKVYILFFVIFIFLVLLKAIVISVEAGTPFEGINYLGLKMLHPTLTLLENSNTIVNHNSFIVNGSLWNTLLVYSDIFSSLIMIFFWIWCLKWIALKLIVWDDSKGSVGYLIAIVLFFLIQAIALAINDRSPLLLWDSLKAFFQAMRHIIMGFAEKGDEVIKQVDLNVNGT